MKRAYLVHPLRSSCSFSVAILLSLLTCSLPVSLLSQERPPFFPAMPFFNYPVSPVGQGMGASAAVLPSIDPTATLDNPAHLGLSSLTNVFSIATMAPKWRWRPAYPYLYYPELTFDVTAVNAGVDLANVFSLPFPVGLGAGYSRFTWDMGFHEAPPPGVFTAIPPSMYGTHPRFRSENLSLSVGVDYWIRLGFGLNFKHATQDDYSYMLDSEKVVTSLGARARDVGTILLIPVADIASRISGHSFELPYGLRPQVDLSAGYVIANIGDEVKYPDISMPDPLPRTSKLGAGLEVALKTRVGNSDWKLLSASIVRQAEAPLWHQLVDGRMLPYDAGAGSVNFLRNVIAGRYTDRVWVRKGWQMQIGEVVTIRGGSVGLGRSDIQSGVDYETYGYTLSLGGLARLLEYVSTAAANTSWVAFIGDHIDLLYSRSTREQNNLFNQIPYYALNLVVKGLPWR